MSLFNQISSADLETSYSARALRKIFWKYPWGNTPLLYLLSLMDKNATDKPKFDWYEGRQSAVSTTTITSGAIAAGGDGPFANAGNTASEAAAGFTWTADTVYNLYVTSNTRFRVEHLVNEEDYLNTKKAYIHDYMTGNMVNNPNYLRT